MGGSLHICVNVGDTLKIHMGPHLTGEWDNVSYLDEQVEVG